MCTIWKKELEYATTRRVVLLEDFQGDIDCSDWTGYLNKKLSLWIKGPHGTDQKHGGMQICAPSMAHVRPDKIWEKWGNNKNPREPHMEIRSKQERWVKEGIREIIKSEDTKKRTNNTIQLVPVLEKQQLLLQTSDRYETILHKEIHTHRNQQYGF